MFPVGRVLVLLFLFVFCTEEPRRNPLDINKKREWACVIGEDGPPDYVNALGCKDDFDALASEPMSAGIPGATTAKTVIDRDAPFQPLYFQNSRKYPIHHEFVSANLSGEDLPIVPSIGQFNTVEYFSKNRRFILGAVTRYAGPDIWTYEIAPYDNADASMIAGAYWKIADSAFFGESLYFHPTSAAVEAEAKKMPETVKVITTDQLYAGMDYQPLNPATSVGRLVFITAAELETEFVNFRDIVVLDAVPNDISVTQGIITQTFQTPLAHINVLSQNRNIPNMALRDAWVNSNLRKLEGKWVRLTVGLFDYSVVEVGADEADEWWERNRPASLSIASMDTAVKDLRDVDDILAIAEKGLKGALQAAIPAFGGKASHYAAFPHMDSSKVPFPDAFAIPVYYYWQFMEQNGFNEQVASMLEDTVFVNNPAERETRLASLRSQMVSAPVDVSFLTILCDKLVTDFPDTRMRFRSSTNAEDLDGFTGAGLYTSKSADSDKPKKIQEAIREVWSSIWYFRAFEERSYRSIDHLSTGMALLVHHSFPEEEASGVAVTANIYDQSGLEPGFFVNVQYGDASVVLPDANVTSDQFIYYHAMKGQPVVYIGRSNVLPAAQETVLTIEQIRVLGAALEEIHRFFMPVYGNEPDKKYAMDTEFKFDQPLNNSGGEPVLSMKQCRPFY